MSFQNQTLFLTLRAVGPDRCCWPWPCVLYAVVIGIMYEVCMYAELADLVMHADILASVAKQLTN